MFLVLPSSEIVKSNPKNESKNWTFSLSFNSYYILLYITIYGENYRLNCEVQVCILIGS